MRILFVMGVLLPALALAEEPTPCAAGRQRTAANAHCCWAGQSWDATHNACAGTPRSCPEGMAPFQDTCITLSITPPPSAPSAPAEDPTATPVFTQIPAGSFHYGCEPNDTHCFGDEKPGREVTLPSFRMMTTETTVAAYRKCIRAGVCSEPKDQGNCNWQSFGRESHPVNCVDWKQASAFCAWIQARLPTAEEWEYAAKGGESRIYPWGNAEPDETRARFGPTDGTTSVGRHPAGASRHHLQDMAGNVSEWTSSNMDATKILVRGGSWIDGPDGLRASFRLGLAPDTRDYLVGFRCVR